MKWFKHVCSSYSDERLSHMTDVLGMEGYGFWWRTLEIIAERADGADDFSCTFSAKKWGNFYGFSAKKFEKFVRIFEKFDLLFVEFSENLITVSAPNLAECKDDWSKRKAKNSGVATEELLRKDKEEDKDIYTPLCTTYTAPPRGDVVEVSAPEKPSHKRFVKPTADEVAAYCAERGNGVDPEAFIAFYESNGWRVGKNPMRDWKAAVRTWEGRRREDTRASPALRAVTVGQRRYAEQQAMSRMLLDSKLQQLAEAEEDAQQKRIAGPGGKPVPALPPGW